MGGGGDSQASLIQNEIKSLIQKKEYIDMQIAVPPFYLSSILFGI